METAIRRAIQEDVLPLAALERRCFPADPWPQAVIARQIGCFLVAEQLGQLVGYAAVNQVLDEGQVDNFAVAPEFRRQGIGDLLMKAVLFTAQTVSLRTLTLEVRLSNTAAISLYKKYGFVPVGYRKNYYLHPREDALLMTLPLSCGAPLSGREEGRAGERDKRQAVPEGNAGERDT